MDSSTNEATAESAHSTRLCTFAATGPHAALQAIFVCRACSNDKDESSGQAVCVCQACADTCHADHNGLEYVGFGPSYCDCSTLPEERCQLKEVSIAAAEKLGIPSDGVLRHVVVPTRHTDTEDDKDEQFLQQVYHIPVLNDSQVSQRLVQKASELVKYTKDTHWIGVADMDRTDLCEMEQLACSIFRNHVKQNELCVNEATSGAEWWVQIKTTSQPENDESRLESATNAQEAVDLHYDKDEHLAETFGLGSFPTLSTVTYLTCSSIAAPTLVFPRTYDQSDDEVIGEMLLSHPRQGKHLVFDGRLLHGAPSHYALRPLTATDRNGDNLRVTFLVNIWPLRPVGVHNLSNEIRRAVDQADTETPPADCSFWGGVSFERRCVEAMDLSDENDLPDAIRGRIELPFVSNGATWIENDEEEDHGLVLVTFPPPLHQSDTVRVQFGPGLQSYLDCVQTGGGEIAVAQNTDPEEACYV